jgi:hypothetical protein
MYDSIHRAVIVGLYYTGLFISPSGISDPCGTVAGMVTPNVQRVSEELDYRIVICRVTKGAYIEHL